MKQRGYSKIVLKVLCFDNGNCKNRRITRMQKVIRFSIRLIGCGNLRKKNENQRRNKCYIGISVIY